MLSTIEVGGESIKFCAAHFTIFSGDERERLHGHNFLVRVAVTAPVGADGLAFNYREIKTRIRDLCNELDEYTLLLLSVELMVKAVFFFRFDFE